MGSSLKELILICPLCKKNKPMMQEHHKIPRAAGGLDGPTILICTECHNAVHVCASKFLTRKGIEAQEIALAIFANRKLAKVLIKSVIAHTLRKKEGKIADEHLEYKVILVFPGKLRRYIEVLAKDNKLSLSDCLIKIIMDHLKRKFPLEESLK